MNRSIPWLLSLTLACATTYAQMSIPGQFNVSTSGDANYSIPINIPTGVAGVQPQLSLNYSSQSGNGVLGIGWAMGGMSAISRCAQTKAQDDPLNWIGGINFTPSDRYCLDGQRLVVIGNPSVPNSIAGVYGSSGAYYVTEQESFQLIQSLGTVGSGNNQNGQPYYGPSYFTVRTKAGIILEYGNTADSQVRAAFSDAGKQVVRMWALSRVTDTKGNYLTYTYSAPDTILGEMYPVRIDYTANSTASPPTAAVNSVIFEYATRPDIADGYQAGSRIRSTRRIINIKTFAGGSLVSDYRIAYVANKISSITECANDGSCRPSTTIAYNSNANGMSSTVAVVANNWGGGDSTWVADMNGDGLDDYVSLNGPYIYVKQSTGTGFIDISYQTTQNWGSSGYNWIADMDNDGLPDIVSAVNGTIHIKKITSSTVVNTSHAVANLWGSSQYTWVADFDGDGYPDIASASGGQIYLKSFTGSGFVSQTFNVISNWGHPTYTWVADFTGDGLPDIATVVAGNVHLKIRTKTGFVDRTWSVANTWGSAGYTWIGDFNGDGITDIASALGSLVYMKISTGNGFVSQQWPVTNNWGASGYTWLGDFNGDGMADIATAIGGNVHMKLSTGTGFSEQSWPVTNAWGGAWTRIGDFNGDGLPDILSPSASTIYIKSPIGSRSVANSFSNGLGRSTSVSYLTLPKALLQGKYTIDTTLRVPGQKQVLVSPMAVVTDAQTSDGVGGARATSYSYGTAVADVGSVGRGMMGFKWQQNIDSATGLRSTTQFRQDFPFNGMAESVTTNLSNGVLISSTATAYACFDPAQSPTAPCSAGSGRRYFVYPTQSNNQGYDLNGSGPLPGSRTTNQNIDLYGNIGSVTTTTLDAGGNPTEHSKTVTNTYYNNNNPASWQLGRLLRSTVVAAGPDVPMPVTPGSGGLPAAPPP